MKWCLAVFVTAVALLSLGGVLQAQTTNAGTPVLDQAQIERAERTQQIEQNRAAFVNELLSQWASEAASRGYDAYWQKGQRNLLGLGADELLALSQKAKDFDTFDKLVFRGFKLNALGDLTLDLVYFPLAPCRLLDTRIGTGTFAGPKAPGTEVAFSVNDSLGPQGGLLAGCGVPIADPPALSVVITAVPTDTGQGNLRAYPTGGTIPTASVVNYQGGVVVAAGTITQSAVTTNELTVRNQGAGTTHIVVDVTGYFAAPAPTALACTIVQSAEVLCPVNVWTAIDATCPTGYTATGGGYDTPEGSLGYPNVWLTSVPLTNGWRIWVDNQASTARRMFSFAKCCRVPKQ
jgi:hypothetical protein